MVRFGRQPRSTSAPIARASSSSAESPLIGSSAPLTQASWWLPRMTHSSGHTEPSIFATTSRAGTSFQSKTSFRWTFAGPGPTRYVIGSAPRQPSGATGPSSAASSGFASP